jgi:hypothetical protein
MFPACYNAVNFAWRTLLKACVTPEIVHVSKTRILIVTQEWIQIFTITAGKKHCILAFTALQINGNIASWVVLFTYEC